MSGIIKINDASIWLCAGWAYDNTVTRISRIVRPENGILADALMYNRTELAGGYFDITKLDNAQFKQLLNAAEAAYQKTIAEGPKAFHDPKFYPGYVKQFEMLLGMLKTDPRAERLAS